MRTSPSLQLRGISPLLALGALLAGCGESSVAPADASSDLAVDVASDGASEAAVDASREPIEQTAFRYLLGRFDSSGQAAVNPAYYAITVVACRVSAPTLGSRVLYLEQARRGMAPYRQRLYVIEPEGGAGDGAVSRVFELRSPSSVVGLCDDPSREVFTQDDVIEREGCAVHLRWSSDRFEGATRGQGCESTLNGASYTTSEVTLRADGFSSLDRGYDSAGRQVWGATMGPYVFERRTPIEP